MLGWVYIKFYVRVITTPSHVLQTRGQISLVLCDIYELRLSRPACDFWSLRMMFVLSISCVNNSDGARSNLRLHEIQNRKQIKHYRLKRIFKKRNILHQNAEPVTKALSRDGTCMWFATSHYTSNSHHCTFSNSGNV